MTLLGLTALLNCLSAAALAVVVFRQCPRRDVGLALGIYNATIAAWSLFYVFWQGAADVSRALLYFKLLMFCAIWINQAFLYFIFVFLRRLPRYRAILYTTACVNLLFCVLNFSDRLYPRMIPRFNLGLWPEPTRLFLPFLIFWQVELLLGFVTLARAFYHSIGFEKMQIRYILTALIIAYLGGNSNWPIFYGVYSFPYLNGLVTVYISIVAYAIARRRLLDISIAIRRTLIYSIVVSILGVIYSLLLLISVRHIEGWMHHTPEFWFPWVAAGITSLVFQPLRGKVQNVLDAHFFLRRISHEEVLVEFSNTVAHEESVEKTTEAWGELLRRTFHPSYLVLYLVQPGHSELNCFFERGRHSLPKQLLLEEPLLHHLQETHLPIRLSGATKIIQEFLSTLSSPKPVLAIPLISRRSLTGILFLGPKQSDEDYREEDLVFLDILAHQASTAYDRPILAQEISSTFVHEIKTPLSGITLPAELTLMEIHQWREAASDSPAPLLDRIQTRMKHILEQAFLASARIDAMQEMNELLPVQREPIEIAVLMQSVQRELEADIKTAQIELDLKAIEPGISVRGHRRQLEVVFTNLFRNAIEAVRSQELPRYIQVKVQERGELAEIHIRDNGPGITKNILSTLFEPHVTTKHNTGHGIGLFLVRRIIEAHGGHISLEVHAKRGASFKIILPTFAVPSVAK